MGTEQVRALNYLEQGESSLSRFPIEGRSMTYSASDSITDSAAGGSALSTGVKTPNGYVACNADGSANETLVEWAEKRGKSTGIVVTVPLTNATPADFYAHVTSRKMEKEIARQFVYSGIDFAVGGYKDYFIAENRDDGQNLLDTLQQRGYKVVDNISELEQIKSAPVVALLSEKDPPHADQRGNWTTLSVCKALEILEKDPDGFFLMVEGSQIDWACHVNDFPYMVQEILDFDKAVSIAYHYAETHPGTLVVVTADHETGGLQIGSEIDNLSAEQAKEKIADYVKWDRKGHSGKDVGIYAFGPGAEHFQGRMENTDIFKKIIELYK